MKETPGCGPCPGSCEGCSTGMMLRRLEEEEESRLEGVREALGRGSEVVR